MNLLLDTHTFIWYIEGSGELSRDARQEIENGENQCFLSMVSLWEMSIKIGLNKLALKGPFNAILISRDDILDKYFSKASVHRIW